jgi:3-isopropylmalate/(R)-2-methylmalate dehydratase small subunit
VPILPRCEGVCGLVETGDELEVDFASGRFVNLTRSVERQFQPLPAMLLDIIALGGYKEALRRRLAEMAGAR